MHNKETFVSILEYVNLNRRKNKLLRETADNDLKIRDNKAKITLIDNLSEYLTDDMSIENVRKILKEMRESYADRIDETRIHNSELSQQRREIRQRMLEYSERNKD